MMITFTYDDGRKDNYQFARPIHQTYGQKVTWGIVTAYLLRSVPHDSNGNSDLARIYMNVDEMKQLQDEGHEIASHSRTHPNMKKIPMIQAEKELLTSKQELESIGMYVNSFLIPYGAWNQKLNKLARKYYACVRGSQSGMNVYPLSGPKRYPKTSRYYLLSWKVLGNDSFDEVKRVIDRAIKERKWLILLLHGIDDQKGRYIWSPSKLEKVCAYIHKRQIPVVTLHEGVQRALDVQ